jgi:hypothetical protein
MCFCSLLLSSLNENSATGGLTHVGCVIEVILIMTDDVVVSLWCINSSSHVGKTDIQPLVEWVFFFAEDFSSDDSSDFLELWSCDFIDRIHKKMLMPSSRTPVAPACHNDLDCAFIFLHLSSA